MSRARPGPPAAPARLPGAAVAAVALLAVLNLLLAAGGGLARLGALPAGAWGPTGPAALAGHGTLMLGGFFGTVIALERAVALQRGLWVPALAGLGGLLAGALGPTLTGALPLAQALWLLSAAGLLGLYAWAWRYRAGSLPLAVEASGAAALLLAHAGLAAGDASLARLGGGAFLVLTIAGERRELMRLRPLPRWAGQAFLVGWAGMGLSLALTLASAGSTEVAHALWWSLLAALATWLLAFDLARFQARAAGWAGHTARCLLAGYAWLAAAAALGLAGHPGAWHALWLGFVWAMVFGHAPIMMPALAGWRPLYTRWALLPVAVMSASLLLRLAGDTLHRPTLAAAAGAGHALAWVLFAALMAHAVRAGARRRDPTTDPGR